MDRTNINATDAPQPVGGYCQAIKLTDAKELLLISGQIPVRPDGTLPETFAEQAAQTWANLDAQLRAAGTSREDLVKVTIFLGSREHIPEYRAARQAYLGDHTVGLTCIVTGIFDEAWLLEIEAVAAR
ncbi:MAG: RidA family protein [Pseudomonadota bacterium]